MSGAVSGPKDVFRALPTKRLPSYSKADLRPESEPGQNRGVPEINTTTTLAAPPLRHLPDGSSRRCSIHYVSRLSKATRKAATGGAAGILGYPAATGYSSTAVP